MLKPILHSLLFIAFLNQSQAQVVVYEHNNFQGAHLQLSGDVSFQQGDALNDRISAISVANGGKAILLIL